MTQSSFSDLVQSLTPEDILREFPDLIETTQSESRPNTSSSSENDQDLFQGQDAEQIKLMEEVCIVVDWNDNPVAAGSKKTCK